MVSIALLTAAAFWVSFLSYTYANNRYEVHKALNQVNVGTSKTEVELPHHLLGRQAGDWKFDDYFEYIGYWPPNEANKVKVAAIGVMEMASTTLRVLDGTSRENQPSGANDPSFRRYFELEDLPTFRRVVERVLGVLGSPGHLPIRDCISPPASKLQLYYNHGPHDPITDESLDWKCYVVKLKAFLYWHLVDGEKRYYMVWCSDTLRDFKLHVPNPNVLTLSAIDPTKFEAWIDDGNAPSTVLSTAAILMHELFHWPDIFSPVLTRQIQDLTITRPDDQSKVKAYRAFYASKVRNRVWSNGQSPLNNVDTYVYTILEIFYRFRYTLPNWEDPPDPGSEVSAPDS